MPAYDCGQPDCMACISEFRTPRAELDEIKRQAEDATEYVLAQTVKEQKAEIEHLRSALLPFALYGTLLQGQTTRAENIMLQLWGYKITVADLRNAAFAMGRS